MSPSFDDGLRTQELIEGIARSDETGTRQQLSSGIHAGARVSGLISWRRIEAFSPILVKTLCMLSMPMMVNPPTSHAGEIRRALKASCACARPRVRVQTARPTDPPWAESPDRGRTAHVLRWRRRDDHFGVAGGAGDLLELLAQTAADTRRTQRCADVEECQLRDPEPKPRHDHTNSNEAPAGERTERDPAIVDIVLERAHPGLDGVFAVTVRVPGRRAPVAVPRDELSATLVVEHVDAFPTVDLDDARQFGPAQPSELDCGFLRLTLAHGLFKSSGQWPARSPRRPSVWLAPSRVPAHPRVAAPHPGNFR